MTGKGEDAGLSPARARFDADPVPAGRSRSDIDRAGSVRGSKTRGTLSELTRTRLSVQLRAMYDTVAQQPVPDRFADLIARLDAADRDGG